MSCPLTLKSCDEIDKSAPSGVREPPQNALGIRRRRTRRRKCPKSFHFFKINLQAAARALLSVRRRDTALLLHPRSLHLHLNNKLKAVKFRHCDYQCNYIIELKTELGSCKMCYQNAGADITARVPQCATRLRMPEFKDSCAILGYNESWCLVPLK